MRRERSGRAAGGRVSRRCGRGSGAARSGTAIASDRRRSRATPRSPGWSSGHTCLVTGATGLPNSVRTAATSTLTGLSDAIHCSTLGRCSIGTNALLEERQREHEHERDAHHRVGRAHRSCRSTVPTQIIADANTSSSRIASAKSHDVGVRAPADDQAGAEQHHDRRAPCPRARRGSGRAGTPCASGGSERKRSITPSVRSVAIAVAGPDEAERERLDEDAADQVLAVAAALHRDRAAEHVREQQHEHQRLQRDVEQLLGDLADVLDVAPREHERVAQRARASRRGRRASRARAPRPRSRAWERGWWSCGHLFGDGRGDGARPEPVRVRKTSSRLA